MTVNRRPHGCANRVSSWSRRDGNTPHYAGRWRAGGRVGGRGGPRARRERADRAHRPKYDDWSFRRASSAPGEPAPPGLCERSRKRPASGSGWAGRWPTSATPCAPAPRQGPLLGGLGRPVGDDDVSGYAPNAEIDEVDWFQVDEARRRLTYRFDVDTLDEAMTPVARRKTRTLVVVRHSQARSRKSWRGDDRERPLLATGRQQAERLVPVLAAYDVRRPVSSSSTRCVQTPVRAVRRRERPPAAHRRPAQRGGGRHPQAASGNWWPAYSSGSRTGRPRPGAWRCHPRQRVFPWVFDALGLEDPALAPGELMVLHLRHGRTVVSAQNATASVCATRRELLRRVDLEAPPPALTRRELLAGSTVHGGVVPGAGGRRRPDRRRSHQAFAPVPTRPRHPSSCPSLHFVRSQRRTKQENE